MNNDDVSVYLKAHGQGEVYVAGIKMPGVIKVQVNAETDGLNTVTVTMRLLCPRMLIESNPSNADMLGTG